VRLALGALAVALAVAASGCGDDSESGATSTAAPPPATSVVTTEAETRPEAPVDQSRWATEVDAACAPVQDQLDAVPPPADPSELGRWLRATLPLVRKQVAAVDAIPLPADKDEAQQAELFVAGLHDLERAITHYGAALEQNDPAATEKALAEASAAGTKTREYALALDITQCGGYSGG
jgi:hypothetical protein